MLSAANAWCAVTVLAGTAAAGSAVAAVGLHAADVAAGYRLAAARRAAVVLRREASDAEQRVSTLRAPAAVLARAAALGLAVGYPSRVLCVHRDDVRFRTRAVAEDSAVLADATRRPAAGAQ